MLREREVEKIKAYIRLKWWALLVIFLVVVIETLLRATGLMAMLSTYAGVSLAAAINLILDIQTRRGKYSLSLLYLSLGFDLLIITTVLYFSGGPENSWWFMPVLVIFIAGYIFDQKTALAYALLAFLALSLIFSLEYSKLIPHFSVYAFPASHWMNRVFLTDYALGMLLLYSMGALISGYFNRLTERSADQLEKTLASTLVAKEEAVSSRKALMNVMEDLNKAKDELEIRVRERTAELEDAKANLEKRVAERTADLEKARRAVQHMLKDLKEDMVKLQAIDRMKTEFLSMVSHELRTPLTPIKGYLSLLLKGKMGKFPPKSQKALNVLNMQSTHLHTLIDSMLDISRIELGKPIPTIKESLSIKAIIQEVADAMEILAEEREHHLMVDLSKDLPDITGDVIKLKRVITNLLGNAIKFTKKGGEIKVRAFAENLKIRVEVIDNGIGIAKENIEKVFEKFHQVDSSFTRSAGGIGMGLTLARELVELHGGKLWVESEGLEKGSKFIFTLPVKGGV
ncbi:MAG: ATP-binding protein [Candidatus Margulisiibacteriota bacterium]